MLTYNIKRMVPLIGIRLLLRIPLLCRREAHSRLPARTTGPVAKTDSNTPTPRKRTAAPLRWSVLTKPQPLASLVGRHAAALHAVVSNPREQSAAEL